MRGQFKRAWGRPASAEKKSLTAIPLCRDTTIRLRDGCCIAIAGTAHLETITQNWECVKLSPFRMRRTFGLQVD